MSDKQATGYFDKIKALHKGAAIIGGEEIYNGVYEKTNSIIQGLLGYPYSTIAVPDGDHFQLYSTVYKSETDSVLPLDKPSIPRRAYQSGKTQLINEVSKDPDFYRATSKDEKTIQSVLAVPVMVGDRVESVIVIDSLEKHGFSELDVDIFEILAMHVSNALQRIIHLKSLLESERRIREIMDQAEDSIILIDFDDMIHYWNPASKRLFGYNDDEALGKTFFELLVPYSQKRKYIRNKENMMRMGDAEVLPPMECICQNKRGEEFSVDVSHSIVRVQGTPHILRMMRDNSKRKEEEERLKALYTHISKLADARTEEDIAKITREAAESVFGVSTGSIALRKGDVLESLMQLDPEQRLRLPITGRGITVRALNTGEIQLVQDITKDPDYIPNYQSENGLLCVSELDVPIKIGNEVVGVVNVESTQRDNFSEGDVRLMTIFAENIASTINRIKLDEARKHYEQQLETLHKSATKLGKARNRDELFDSSMSIIKEILGYQWIGIAEPQEDGLKYVRITDSNAPNILIPYNTKSVTLRAYNAKSTIWVKDVTQDPDYILVVSTEIIYKSELVVPVIVEDEVIALVNIESSEEFNSTDKNLMEIIALHMASELERINYEEKIRESELRLRTIKENAVDAIFIISFDGTVTLWNKSAERIFGYTADYAIGKKINKLIIPPEEYDAYNAKLKRLFTSEEYAPGKTRETPSIRANGERFTLGFTASPVTMKGEPHAVFIARDITLEKKTEEQLQQLNVELARSNQDLENYTYVVSHDLKAPLRSIRSFSSFLLEDYGDKLEGDGREYLDRVIAAVTRMDDLISDLLTISRIGRKFTEVAEIDLNELLENIRLDLSATIEAKKAEIMVSPLPVIEGQQIWVSQLFTNLISNGLKFNKSEHPVIKIECQHRAKDILFSVSDNGIGIPQQYHESIFKLFERLHTTDEYEGTGAGLTICKKIVENFGGKIWVESEEGKGSTFYFTYPIKN